MKIEIQKNIIWHGEQLLHHAKRIVQLTMMLSKGPDSVPRENQRINLQRVRGQKVKCFERAKTDAERQRFNNDIELIDEALTELDPEAE